MRRATVWVSSAGILMAAVATLVWSLTTSPDASVPGGFEGRVHPLSPPFLMFRALAPAEAHGRVGLLALAVGNGVRQTTQLSCLRLHYAGGRGLCLVREAQQGQPVYAAYAFDRSLVAGRRVALSGVPTRVRVAPNGRLAAITIYAEEEAEAGERLASHSVIIALPSMRVIADLAEFTIEHHDRTPLPKPIDISSVAFERGGDRFFVTLSTPMARYLAAGSVEERRITAIKEGVATEGLSPSEQRLAVKRRVGDHGFWQLSVIDLRTWSETALAQGPRSVDDQVEWLDDEHVVYHDADNETTSIWVLPIDGVTGPRVLVKDAYSVVVQR